jgi:hypothetical protein
MHFTCCCCFYAFIHLLLFCLCAGNVCYEWDA